ncbi:MAG: enoyl-CoA hydratase [Porticoccaceae bacterium]|nr:MAG: enoyl-CoA hydratase [Porticoccaceae bacterium]
MVETPCLVLPATEVPEDPGWLAAQPRPVVAVGEGPAPGADVVVATFEEARALAANIRQNPRAALVLVQVLRAVEALPPAAGLAVESLGYATLQGGEEFARWLAARGAPPALVRGEGPAVLARREGDRIRAWLNRPERRNALSVEMRDALVELLEVVCADPEATLELAAVGPCFSVGGELAEFGLFGDTARAHWVRSVHYPSRLLLQCGERVVCRLHGACLGSGMELPAFAGRVVAHPKTFFQLPELRLGLIPGAGGCVSLTRRIGRQRTAWLALSMRRINARTALAWGLVDELSEALPEAPVDR